MTIKTETVREFILRGGKLEVLPAQKVVYKQFCRAKTAYLCGRIAMRNDPRNSSYVIKPNLFKNKVV
jgi:hypothetical protein